MGCSYCLNVAIHTWKAHSGMQLLPECCYTYTKVHNGMQLLPECCYTYMESSVGCSYCLNVVIHTWKVYNGLQVLPECCNTYTESSQWDAVTA